MRPAWWQVTIVASCAAGATVSYALGLWDQQYAAWLALLLAMELGAAASEARGDTFSERLWAWLGVHPARPSRWWRVAAAVIFLAEFAAHVATAGDHWWSGGIAIIVAAIPLSVAVITGFLKWRVTRWLI